MPLTVFHIEHITAIQHGGNDEPDNLALACDRCNAFKGPNLAAIDPETGATVPLFSPRVHVWTEHFRQAQIGFQIIGITPMGRATARLLNRNARRRVQLREQLQIDLHSQ